MKTQQVLTENGDATTTFNSSSLDLTNYDGAWTLDIIRSASTGSPTVTIQCSNDNSNWFTYKEQSGVSVTNGATNTIKSVNGVYEGEVGAFGVIQKKATFRKDAITRITLTPSETAVLVWFKGTHEFISLSFNGAGTTKQVDSVDSNTPSSNSDLYDKLIALIA